ncbi:MAG: hypothetical protein HY695_36105 [Deltaproteobacteria bacterium]|nr:hypothetical protein [Deltaproteobacteria bacterium]
MSNPPPPGWNKTIDDLFEEMKQGKRLFVGGDEGDWARDYERSLLPPGTVFPRGGQVWEVVDECDVQVDYIFAAPAGCGGNGGLRKGERVRIMTGGTDPEPLIVFFLPVRYDDLHDTLVPAKRSQ